MRSIVLMIVIAALTSAAFGQAQELKVPTLSPLAEVTQEVALTSVKLSYSRPSAKGRKVYGDLVPFGEVWRTGANASTKLTFAEDVKIEGNALKAGTYALYTIPDEKEWTIIIHTNTRHRSLAGDVYKQAEDAFRFKVKPTRTANFVETFTIAFTDLATSSCKLALRWENTEVKFGIEFDVIGRVNEQIAAFTGSSTGMTHQNYFLAAEFYFHNDHSVAKAEEWIGTALEKSPKNSRYGLLKAKIQSKAGKRDEALKTIAEANAWAREAKNANYAEQTQIFWDSIKKK